MKKYKELVTPHYKILASGLQSDILDKAYGELDLAYADGRGKNYANSLYKARNYLRYWPKPFHYTGTDMWFVGDLSANIAAKKQGLQLVGYQCIPSRNLCACRWVHPWKRNNPNIVTCTCVQVVLLYQKALEYEVRRTNS